MLFPSVFGRTTSLITNWGLGQKFSSLFSKSIQLVNFDFDLWRRRRLLLLGKKKPAVACSQVFNFDRGVAQGRVTSPAKSEVGGSNPSMGFGSCSSGVERIVTLAACSLLDSIEAPQVFNPGELPCA